MADFSNEGIHEIIFGAKLRSEALYFLLIDFKQAYGIINKIELFKYLFELAI